MNKDIYKDIVDNKLKKGTILYHVVDNNTRIIEVEITEVNSNDNGIYVYAKGLKENEDGTVDKYRFILTTYGEIKKSHFNKEVFYDIDSAKKFIDNSKEYCGECEITMKPVCQCGYVFNEGIKYKENEEEAGIYKIKMGYFTPAVCPSCNKKIKSISYKRI